MRAFWKRILWLRSKCPGAEKKVVKSLDSNEVNQIIMSLGNSFDGVRNKAIILVLVDCGLRLGELLNIQLADINMEQQVMKVDGKTGERVVRYAVKFQGTLDVLSISIPQKLYSMSWTPHSDVFTKVIPGARIDASLGGWLSG